MKDNRLQVEQIKACREAGMIRGRTHKEYQQRREGADGEAAPELVRFCALPITLPGFQGIISIDQAKDHQQLCPGQSTVSGAVEDPLPGVCQHWGHARRADAGSGKEEGITFVGLF